MAAKQDNTCTTHVHPSYTKYQNQPVKYKFVCNDTP